MFGSFKAFIPWLATTTFCLFLIVSSNNPQADSLRGGLSDFIALGTAPLSNLLHFPKIWKENRAMKRKLVEMTLQIAQISDRAPENERLRRMLGFSADAPLELTAARVIGMNPDMGVRGVLINRGASVGIAKNMAAIAPEGVIGRVYRVGEYTAAVQLLTDPNIGVAGRLMKGREIGIVRAEAGRMLKLDGIPVTAEISPGDTVVTTGLGGIFPENLFIGVVHDVTVSADGWLWDIFVLPGVDFSRLDELFIVKGVRSEF